MFDEPNVLDEEFPPGEGSIEPTAEVVCPYCGEPREILIDPGGGTDQAYVQDCEVCCRPWTVRVRFMAGIPSVEVGTEDDPAY